MKVTIRQKSGMKYLYADIQVSGLRYKSTLGISVNDGEFNLEKQCVEGGTNTETNILISSFKVSTRATTTLKFQEKDHVVCCMDSQQLLLILC